MKKIALSISIVIMLMSISPVASAASQYISFKGKVRGINVSSGGFLNTTSATIEVTLDIGITRKDVYSICHDISEREYSALLALLIDSRSRNQETSFSARPVTGDNLLWCLYSITSP